MLQRDRLAVEDQVSDTPTAPQRLDDLRHRRRHVVAAARVDTRTSSPDLVHLDARAVDLPFDRGGAERVQGCDDIVGWLREHRRDRLHRPQRGVARVLPHRP